MSPLRDSLCAFAAGSVVSCVVYAATALPAETRASIDNFMFKPDTITVPVGTAVVWQNDDEIPHTVTLGGRHVSFPAARHQGQV